MVTTAVKMWIVVFWIVTPCIFVWVTNVSKHTTNIFRWKLYLQDGDVHSSEMLVTTYKTTQYPRAQDHKPQLCIFMLHTHIFFIQAKSKQIPSKRRLHNTMQIHTTFVKLCKSFGPKLTSHLTSRILLLHTGQGELKERWSENRCLEFLSVKQSVTEMCLKHRTKKINYIAHIYKEFDSHTSGQEITFTFTEPEGYSRTPYWTLSWLTSNKFTAPRTILITLPSISSVKSGLSRFLTKIWYRFHIYQCVLNFPPI
jgi:hypothetical protein